MGETLYEVLVDKVIVAQNMQLNYATILVEGIFQKYFNDTKLEVTIRRMEEE